MEAIYGVSYDIFSDYEINEVVVIMKTVVMINSVPYGSTAQIMLGIEKQCEINGIAPITSTGYSYHPIKEIPENNIKIGSCADKFIHMELSRITGYNGCFSYMSTKRFLKKIDSLRPDIIHLHNVHGWYINIPSLFNYIKNHNIRVIWTLHDCWAFTGQCPHFSMAGCFRWKDGCGKCPQINTYPEAYVDRSGIMWKKKKEWFNGVKDLTIVTPSYWLANLVKESFLKCYPVKVIHNGIDLSVFKPMASSFRERYKIGNKVLLLGVSFGWSRKKGLDVFVDLSKRLNSHKYQIVLVGTDEKVDKLLPPNIISIHRTQNQRELAEIYTAADLFVNPTREEVLGLVNIEALACGTPVVTFRSGGSPECIDEGCGSIIEPNDIDKLEREIERITEIRPFTVEACIARAKEFEQTKKYREYLELYSNSPQIER